MQFPLCDHDITSPFSAPIRRDPAWGVRDIADVTRCADACGLALERTVDMPRDNFSLVFRTCVSFPIQGETYLMWTRTLRRATESSFRTLPAIQLRPCQSSRLDSS